MDNLNMTAEKDLAQIQKNKKGDAYIASHMSIYYSKQASSGGNREFDPRSGQAKDYTIA